MSTKAIEIIPADTDALFEDVYRIRARVFQEEMGLSEEDDLDGHDHIAHHFLARMEGKAVATARWRVTLGGKLTLERVAVLPEFRKMGIGTALVKTLLRWMPIDSEGIFIDSHLAEVPFWEKLGFMKENVPYEWMGSGFSYQKMTYSIQNSDKPDVS